MGRRRTATEMQSWLRPASLLLSFIATDAVGSTPDIPRADNPSAEPVRTKEDTGGRLAELGGRVSLLPVLSSHDADEVEARESLGFCKRDIAF